MGQVTVHHRNLDREQEGRAIARGRCGKRQRRALSRTISLLCVGAIGTFGAPVDAAPAHPVELEYDAPADCPSREAVVARIEGLVRHAPGEPLRARVHIERSANGYHLQLLLEGGKKSIVSKSCNSLVESLTVVLALAIDPRAASSLPPPEAPTSPPEVPAPTPPSVGASSSASPPPSAPVPSAPSPAASASPTRPRAPVTAAHSPEPPRPRAAPKAVVTVEKPTALTSPTSPANPASPASSAPPELRLRPELGVLIESGMLPSVGAGPVLGLWLDRDRASLSATAEWLVPRWAQLPGTDQAIGGYISFLGGQVDLCWAHLQSRALRTCAGVEAGDLMGKGSGLTQPQLGHGMWLAGVVETSFRLTISPRVAADLRLGLALPVKRPAFGLDGYDWRFEPRGWSLRFISGFLWF